MAGIDHEAGPTAGRRDLDATLDALLAVAVAGLGADAGAIYLVEAGALEMRLRCALGYPADAIGHRLASGEGLGGRVLAERRSQVSDDVARDPRAVRRRPDWDREPVTTSYMGVPLRAGPFTIGVLEVTCHRSGAFSPQARGRAAVYGDAMALLIEETRLAAGPPSAALQGVPLEGEDAVAVATLDGQLRVTDANPAFARLVGRPVETLLGRPAVTILPALGRPRARDALEATLHGTSGHLGRVRTATEGDRDLTLSVSLVPVADPAHGVLGVMIVATDVSDRARLEAELRAQNARALEARDRLRAVVEVVSHELRTPLTSVLGYARLLHDREDADRDRRAHWSGLVIEKARLMARLVDEVTDFARLGSDRMTLNVQRTDLVALVFEVVRETNATSERHEVEVLAGDVGQVSVDRDRIRQVLTNLLGNAVKFWPDGGLITVTVAEEGHAARIDVEDRGPGVPVEMAERIFEPFYRAQTEATRDVPGTGLGLAISRGIVEAHGGRLWLESPTVGGSRFCLTLALADPPHRVA